MAKKNKLGTDPGHPEVQAYFAEAASPSIIGTSDAQTQLMATLETAGLVIEQLGRSRRLLNAARISAQDPAFFQGSESLNQAFGAAVRDTEEVQRLMVLLAQHIQQINLENPRAKQQAIDLGYVFP